MKLTQTGILIKIHIAIWFLFSIYYEFSYCIPWDGYAYKKIFRRLPRQLVPLYNGTEDYLIDTPGCYIPNYSKTFNYKTPENYLQSCGQRAVLIKKISDDVIAFTIRYRKMTYYIKNPNKPHCWYSFVKRSDVQGSEDIMIEYTEELPFTNGDKIELKQEVIYVKCSLKKKVIYSDIFIIIKKKFKAKTSNDIDDNKMNVLLIGMDTMSRSRVYSTMPSTVKYFEDNNWLDFRGYHKVGVSTYLNIMALLSGKTMTTIYKTCQRQMYKCNDIMMWSKYRDANYITAFAEDNLQLPDIFGSYGGYRIPPTDHYARTFFLTGENKKGKVVCTSQRTSALNLLDYALDFTKTYVNDNFFGFFWLNSYSQNPNMIPNLVDNYLSNFFDQLENSGTMNDTFVFFLSDHGLRFGEMRVPVESYYDDRLPMLFMWVPEKFRHKKEEMYYNLRLNQHRLISTYDLHMTLWDILNIYNVSVDIIGSEACPKCTSLFKDKSGSRTCAEAGVVEKWCSCGVLNKVNEYDKSSNESLNKAITYIQEVSASVESKYKTEKCSTLKLNRLLRHHWLLMSNKKYYILAIEMTPGNLRFEVNIKEENGNYSIIGPTDTISPYNKNDYCVKMDSLRAYCYCVKIK